MRKVILVLGLLIICIGSISASASEPTIAFEDNDFHLMRTTGYCIGEITANGSAVHEGGCASSEEHLGDVAIIYTLDGEYLGMYECNDLGGAEGIQMGCVIDVYFESLDRCKEWMSKTGGKVMVKYVHGEG